ncbi:GDSL esterase/lipase At5g41890 [Aristolochia californica]|uniref:GDSL esterase/lipase At5g41890 n=1 Tax=Aristolochia californica TaxID=171875 RepID=UPI0035DFBF0C
MQVTSHMRNVSLRTSNPSFRPIHARLFPKSYQLHQAMRVLCAILSLQLEAFQSIAVTLFIFGDSLVDAGNNDYLSTLSKADFPPYGIDFPASGGRPTGRFTNGRTIADIVGQELGAKTFPTPFLDPDSRRDTFDGINYASGASGILDETGSTFIQRISLRRQVEYFKQTRDYMVEVLGANRTEKALQDALFSITAGSNDIINNILSSVPFFQPAQLPPSLLVDIMVSNLTSYLQRLYELGGRKFVVVGVGPLGCIPFVRSLTLEPRGRCSESVNQLVKHYNSKLISMLDRLNQELGPETTFVYANSYQVFWDIIQNHEQYGIENSENACCGGDFPPLICYRVGKLSSAFCEDRSKFVFWDAYHPTEAVNKIIAGKLLDGDTSICYPINIRFMSDLVEIDIPWRYQSKGSIKMSKHHNIKRIKESLTTMHGINVGIKRSVKNEKSFMLWHRRLGHIFIDRIKRLVNDGVLETLDFIDFSTCVDCINGKQTNKYKNGAKRTSDVLEIIHVDISDPYDISFNGQKYFITFIDDNT